MAYLNPEQVNKIHAAVKAGEAVDLFDDTYVPAVRRGGCWVAYHHDRSGMAVFGEEVEALRYAVVNSMAVAFWRFGDDFLVATQPAPTPEELS